MALIDDALGCVMVEVFYFTKFVNLYEPMKYIVTQAAKYQFNEVKEENNVEMKEGNKGEVLNNVSSSFTLCFNTK